MFEVPDSDIVKVCIDENVILGKKEPEYIRVANKNSQAESLDLEKPGDTLEEQKDQAKTYA